MNQSSCCCGDSEFMDAAYCYYYPNRRCFKSDCAACPYTASALSRDVEHCFCHSSCTPSCSSDCNSCCCSLSGLSDAAQTDAQDADGCAGIACKKGQLRCYQEALLRPGRRLLPLPGKLP